MDAQILIDKAKVAAELHSPDGLEKAWFHVGYLETTIRQLCYVLEDTEEIMYRQRELIEQMKKGYSADL
jgi:hypothetical protein